MSKVHMKETDYYKSGIHIKNAKQAGKLGLLVIEKKKLLRIEEYTKNPTKCLECSSTFEYDKKNKKFCNRSCSAKFNNNKRIENGFERTVESRLKTSESRKGRVGSNNQTRYCKIYLIECKVCKSKKFVDTYKKNNKTCGSEDCILQCITDRSYQNGGQKIFKYLNKIQNKVISLQSSWELEVATLLDELNINWIRPENIKWNDSTGKLRRYFPDFYLIDFDTYLDPKNPLCMKNDKEKIGIISKQVKLIVGDIQLIKQYIESIK